MTRTLPQIAIRKDNNGLHGIRRRKSEKSLSRRNHFVNLQFKKKVSKIFHHFSKTNNIHIIIYYGKTFFTLFFIIHFSQYPPFVSDISME